MSFSQEVRIKIGGDITSLRRSFAEAASAAEAAGKKIDQSLAAKNKMVNTLLAQRNGFQMKELGTLEKIRYVTGQLAKTAVDQKKFDQGSQQFLQKQIQLEQKMFTLRKLQVQAQKDRVAGMPGIDSGAGGGGGGGGSGGATLGETVMGGMFKRILFLGVGTIMSAAVNSVKSYFASQAQIAGAQEESTGAGLASTQSRIAHVGGLTGQLRMGQQNVSGLEAQKGIQQNTVKDLSSGVLGALAWVTPEGRAALTAAEMELAKINGLLQQQHDANAKLTNDIKLHSELLQLEGVNLDHMTRLQARGQMTPAAVSERALFMAQEKLNLTRKNRPTDAFAIAQATLERNQARNVNTGVQMEQRQRIVELRRQFTGMAAEPQVDQFGRPLAPSETQRLAQQAQEARRRANVAVLSGASGEVGFQTDRAKALEATVAQRLSGATKGTQNDLVPDMSSLQAELIKANTILDSIKNSLTTTTVK